MQAILRLLALLSVLVSAAAQAGDVYVAVAANFAEAAAQIGGEFQRQTGNNVYLIPGSSGKLYAQIKTGAPYDVLLSADVQRAQRLEQEQLAVRGSRFTYARGRLVLWSPHIQVVDAEILRTSRFAHLALANPEIAPYGAAAREVLERLNLLSVLGARLVYGEDIGQTFQLAATGAADLAFVALSQLRTARSPVAGGYWLIPPDLYQPIKQQAVLLRRAEDNLAARAFLDFLKGPKARAVMSRYGYAMADESKL
ncbi:MAG: molybdate ABC transporter substrate-binding protein [Sulfuricaulis sp.]